MPEPVKVDGAPHPLPGERFGRLTVISEGPDRRFARGPTPTVICRCDCGVVKTISIRNLRYAGTKSCGCLHRELLASRSRTHGQVGSPEYNVWSNIKTRCLNPNVHNYGRYGGRGIGICGEWRDSFASFLRDVGRRPSPKHTIERINNNRGYEPGNVRWATVAEQNRNTSHNRWLTHNGETLVLADWAKRLGIATVTLSTRLKRGWDLSKALSTPNMEKQHGR